MALREREVTGFVVDGDGSPVTNGTISFKPTSAIGFTDTHVVVDRVFTTTTDETGEFAITLWCDNDALLPIDYTVKFPIANNGSPSETNSATISLSYEDGSPKNIGILIGEGTDPDDIADNETLIDIIDERIALAGGGGGGGPAVWGAITGTLADQLDLNSALAAKVPTSRSITGGEGLTGGGALTSDRTLSLNINGLTEVSALDGATDFLAFWDESSGGHRKVAFEDLPDALNWNVTGPVIGESISGAASEGVLFADTSGILRQDATKFRYDDSNDTLKLGDASYLGNTAGASATSGWQNSKAFLKIGFDTAYANNDNPVYAAQFDMKRSMTGGAGQQTSGIRPRAWLQQTGGSGAIATAAECFVENTGSTVANMLQAVEGICQTMAATVWVSGGWFQVTGNAAISFASWVVRAYHGQDAGTAAKAVGVEVVMGTNGAGAITNGIGVNIDGWSGGGFVNSVALYIGANTNRGTTSAYAIRCLSTALSTFAGDIEVPHEAYGVGWATSNEVPTKKAVYDKIEAASLGGGGATSPLVLTASNALETPLSVVAASGQSASLMSIGIRSTFNANGDYRNDDGQILMYYGGDLRGGWHPTQGGFMVTPDWGYCFTNATNFNTIDVSLKRVGVGIVKIADGGLGATGGGALQMAERTAPSAPSANNVIIYAEDNGSGKTRLMALFATGTAQQIAIEP